MNSFVIAAGCHVASLTEYAMSISTKTRTVEVNMDGNACKVLNAADHITKVKDKGLCDKKKKMAGC